MISALRRSPWCMLALVVALVCTSRVLFWAACKAPGLAWNDARIAPSFAIARGLALYTLPDSGEQLGWMYGPVFPLWFLPAALTDNPTTALVFACLWNAATLLLGVGLLLAAARLSRLGILFGVALCAAWFVATPGIDWVFHVIHVDGLCLALGWLACVALHRAVFVGGAARWLPVAAAALVLACWTKQIAVALTPAMIVWLWLEGRRDLVWPLLRWCFLIGGTVTLVFLSCFGAAETLFYTVIFHLHIPFYPDALANLASQFKTMIVGLWPCAIAGAWLSWIFRKSALAPLPSPTTALIRLLALAALFQAPLGTIAMIKAGGGNNSLHSEFYLLACLVIVLGHVWVQLSAQAKGFRSLHGMILCGLTLVVANLAWHNVRQYGAANTVEQGEARMLAVARAHPGKVYLPWHPMIMIITEGRVFPFDDALLGLVRAGYQPSPEKVRAFFPKGTLIVYPDPIQSKFALQYVTPPPNSKPAEPR